VVDSLDPEQQEDMGRSPLQYADKIKRKIEGLMSVHAERVFNLWIQQGRIKCVPTYAFKGEISPAKFASAFPKSLYKAEEEMNELERKVAWELANLPNIKWWHRNMSRTGFNINGYVNAFPDIIATTKNGHILMIEPKGDHLENTESARKADIGSIWANKAGDAYRYYMVFENKDLKINGAERLDRFMEIVRGL
jgi:type III restriction enzyme